MSSNGSHSNNARLCPADCRILGAFAGRSFVLLSATCVRAGEFSFTLLAVILGLCCHAQAAVTLTDSGAYLSWNSEMYWVSDDVIIFGGYDGSKGVPWQLRPPLPKPISTARFLEYRYSSRRLLDRGLISGGGPCFDGGFVRYARPVPEVEDAALHGKWQAFYGKYGQELPLTPKPSQTVTNSAVRSWNCQWEYELPELPVWANGRQIKRLRPEHGFLEMTSAQNSGWRPTKLITSARGLDRAIPLKGLDGLKVEGWFVFEPSINAYLFGGKRELQPSGATSYELWRLFLDGKLEQLIAMDRESSSDRGRTFRLPSGSKVRFEGSVSAILPLGNSMYIFHGGFFDKRGRLSDSGIYLLEAMQVKKLAKGRVSALVLSPSGCRVATGVDTQDPIGPDQFRVHIVDACGR